MSNPGTAVRKAGRNDLWFYRATYRKPPVVTLCGAQKYSTVSQDPSVAAWCHVNEVEKLNIFFAWHMICILFLIPLSKTQFQASWSSFLHSMLSPKATKCAQALGRVFLARWEPLRSVLPLYFSSLLSHWGWREKNKKGAAQITLNSRSPKSWWAGGYTETSLPRGGYSLLQDGLLSSR